MENASDQAIISSIHGFSRLLVDIKMSLPSKRSWDSDSLSQIIQEKFGEINELARDDPRNQFVRDRWETQPNDKCLLQGWKRMLDRLKGKAESNSEARYY